ncbi:MOSC domain-containing protein [Halopiger goleimassiliensis]|uniref:MOSC domain-containing protein n=1 Tax=Halopiger goleimassiliensis TaxID=1293048 RepID=UPI000677BE0D|nr:MOSC domain-containing protein [Halopiger goleimassiliensis]
MSSRGTTEGIFIAPDSGDTMESVDSVEAVAGRGLRGDRYFREQGLYDRRDDLPDSTDVTLIEVEALEAARREYDLEIRPRETRRNVLTRGVPLNHLVDREFTVGEATLVGERLCEPCSYMESLAEREGAAEALVHRGGLNANVLESGTIAVGDGVEIAPSNGSSNASGRPTDTSE